MSGKYAAEFDSNHFAISGRAVAQVKEQIQVVVAEHTPDLIMVLLGFNDLAFGYGDAAGTISNMQKLIGNARSAYNETSFVIGNVVQRTWTGNGDLVRITDQYNKLLRATATTWSEPKSPVVWAPVREEYDCGPQYLDDPDEGCPAAHDGLHASELGEYQIARAFSRALIHGLKIGTSPLEVPANIPKRSLPAPEHFQMEPSDVGVTATWDKVFGAYSYDTEYSVDNATVNPPLHFSPKNVPANRWDTFWAYQDERYNLRVRPIAGNRKGDWTTKQKRIATPITPEAPVDVTAYSTPTGIDVNWTIPSGAYTGNLFNIYYWDVDVPCTNALEAPTAAFEGTSGHIDGLIVGHQYNVLMEAWSDVGPGVPRNIGPVVVGKQIEATPREAPCPDEEEKKKLLGDPPTTDPIDPTPPKSDSGK